jgi:FkbM family methyltransferase
MCRLRHVLALVIIAILLACVVRLANDRAALLRQIREHVSRDSGDPIGTATDPELAALLYRYFPRPLSQHYEEAFIRDYFQDRKGGFLLDVGASHYKIRSTTYYLDVALGWRGIAVDAIAELGPDFVKYRPRTKFFGVFVSDRTDADVDFFVVLKNSRLSTADPKLAKAAGAHETRRLKTVTLNDLLESQGVEEIDLLSMDVELWEPRALAGFDIDKYKPELVVIESHAPVRQALYGYFAAHNYVEIEKYTKWDGRNAYFIPKADLPKFLAREGIDELAPVDPTPPLGRPSGR